MPLEQLQQRLLHPLSAHVARDAGVVALARNLVDFVDEHDASLSGLDVVVCGLQQARKHAFHVFPDVASLGQHRGVGDAKGDVEHAGDGLGQQRFSRPRFSHEDDVAFVQFHL